MNKLMKKTKKPLPGAIPNSNSSNSSNFPNYPGLCPPLVTMSRCHDVTSSNSLHQ